MGFSDPQIPILQGEISVLRVKIAKIWARKSENPPLVKNQIFNKGGFSAINSSDPQNLSGILRQRPKIGNLEDQELLVLAGKAPQARNF